MSGKSPSHQSNAIFSANKLAQAQNELGCQQVICGFIVGIIPFFFLANLLLVRLNNRPVVARNVPLIASTSGVSSFLVLKSR